jgi:FkbM family methyltransferase
MTEENQIEVNKETFIGVIKNSIKYRLFNFLTKDSCNLFLRGQDAISTSPQIFGIHEKPLTNSIKHYARTGYSDFLIDIGANVGLTSCQNGPEFQEIHMFEPNPYCCRILEVNAHIALESSKFNIHKYGLGEVEKNCFLTIPKHNWGGAFINDDENSYEDNILASKDGLEGINSDNYFNVEIVIKNTENELKELFHKFTKKGFNKGVIKIDVEGYEESVLIGIAKSIPSNVRVAILFESWDNNFNLEKVIKAFNRQVVAKKINRYKPWKNNASNLTKLILLLINPVFKTKITQIKDENLVGDLILEIN